MVLHAIFNFHEMTDRAVITSNEEPFAVADGTIDVGSHSSAPRRRAVKRRPHPIEG